MQVDAGLHNLWQQCCVSVIRAAWTAQDAAVKDKLAAGAHVRPFAAPDGAEVSEAACPVKRRQQSQSDVWNMVSQFCAIRPNRGQQGPGCQDGRVRQALAHAAQRGNGADEEGLLGEPFALGSLGGPAQVHAGVHRSSEAAGSGIGSYSGSASSAARGSPSLLVVNGLGQLAAWGSCAGRGEAPAHSSAARCAWVEGAVGSNGSRQAAYNAQRLQLECEILVEVGLIVSLRCDQCTNTSVLVFNELCEPCRVEVEGQARAYINGALS